MVMVLIDTVYSLFQVNDNNNVRKILNTAPIYSSLLLKANVHKN